MRNFSAVPTNFAMAIPAVPEETAMDDGLGAPHNLIPSGPDFRELSMRPQDWSPERHVFKTAIAQLKVDGIAAIFIEGRFWSLQGTPLFCCDHLVGDVAELERFYGRKMVVPCEYENGQFRETISAMRSGKAGLGRVWAYDAVPFDEWKADNCHQPLIERLNVLSIAFAGTDGLKGMGMLHHWQITADQVEAEVNRLLTQDLEGIVVKDADSLFKRERSLDWLRAKVQLTQDGIVCAVTDKALVVNFGIYGQQKISLASIPGEVNAVEALGRAVEVAFNLEAGTNNARHVRFVRWREDKEA